MRPHSQDEDALTYHCFVSYTTREDEVRFIQPFVDAFLVELQRWGMTIAPVFYDHLEMEQRPYSGRELRQILGKAINRSVCMVSFVSPGYLSSLWCVFEWAFMDGVSLYRGPSFSAILPIVWKALSDGERSFLEDRRAIRIENDHPWDPPVGQRDSLGRRYTYSPFKRCVEQTVEFAMRKLEEIERQGSPPIAPNLKENLRRW